MSATYSALRGGGRGRCTSKNSLLRNILLDGLALESEVGFNPYQLGVIGSTDTHTSDLGNTNTTGHSCSLSASRRPRLRCRPIVGGRSSGGRCHSAFLAWRAGWCGRKPIPAPRSSMHCNAGKPLQPAAATSNPIFCRRPSRKYRYPRGFDSTSAYERGVPMGGDLAANPIAQVLGLGRADPAEAPLDRVQIVKGWVSNGETQQRVWDVVCSNERAPGEDGKCPSTTAEVDLGSCERIGSGGAAELQATFSDSEFSADQPAFYYVRVLENPTCRWTTLLANSAGKQLPADLAATVQQRGWSSPGFG